MDDNKASQLHAALKDFFEYLGYDDTLSVYKDELEQNKVAVSAKLPTVSDDKEIVKAKDELIKSFLMGNQKRFWLLWNKHIPETCREKNDTQRLEFKLNLYFAVYPMINGEYRQSPVEASMLEFKNYLETKGASLSQTTEFVAFYALPFVPNPKSHPTFKLLFEDTWKDDLLENLSKFIKNTLHSEPLPFIYKLMLKSDQDYKSNKSDKSNQIANLTRKIQEQDIHSKNVQQRFAKLQGDYHNLIGIAAELVDSLEKCVRGQMVTPEYLQDICARLFGSAIDQPGTTGSMLRASIQNDIPIIKVKDKNGQFASLDFRKIQFDLESNTEPRRNALLLQALIWRLTKSKAGKQRDNAIIAYISSDLLGCKNDSLKLNVVSKIFKSADERVTEYLARFINVVASFSSGRQYLSQSEAMVMKLVEIMTSSKRDSLLHENILGGLQKLSLRRNVQTVLIDSSVIEWLLETLEDPDNITDYALEYTVALLMNLCLRVSGKKRCSEQPDKVLKLLTDLLAFEDHEIRPYINGTLYSILALPSFKTAASLMGLEETLKSYIEDETQDERQLCFILKQLNTSDESLTDDDVESDGDDGDDDDDEEGDAVETECEKEESIHAMKSEECGERLLIQHYGLSSKSTSNHKKVVSRLNIDEPFTRPVTPGTQPYKANSAPSLQVGCEHRQLLGSPQERPHTSSSRGSEKSKKSAQQKPANQKKGKPTNFKEAFASRPKIPRSPDVRGDKLSNPKSPDIPPLTRSASPQRPSTGKSNISSYSNGSGKGSP